MPSPMSRIIFFGSPPWTGENQAKKMKVTIIPTADLLVIFKETSLFKSVFRNLKILSRKKAMNLTELTENAEKTPRNVFQKKFNKSL